MCEIKFRFRIYNDLFRCLDLIEARSDKDERQRQYAPVIIGWMRAEADAELGQPAEALTAAESAWKALPQQYRDGSAVYDSGANPLKMIPIPLVQPMGTILGKLIFHDDFERVVVEAGGSVWARSGAGPPLRALEAPRTRHLRAWRECPTPGVHPPA